MTPHETLNAKTIAHVLAWRAEHMPDQLAFLFTDDLVNEDRVGYSDLYLRAQSVAAAVRDLPAGPLILAFPAGADFVAAFFGALYARRVAVPVALPRPGGQDAEHQRLMRICADCRPAGVLTTSTIAPFIDHAFEAAPMMRLPVVAVDALDRSPGVFGAPDPSEVAMLQYTSGSTSFPKGVVLTHDNIMANQAMIQWGFGLTPGWRAGGWLPHYHDMGLFGLILQPIYLGVECYLMSPLTFIQRPHLWLQMIDRYRLNIAGGPSSAYEICIRRCRDEQVAGLDLSCWKLAYDAAEPVSAAVHRRFAERFAPQGFLPSAFFACYGLAEATVFVTGGPWRERLGETLITCDPEALSHGHFVLSDAPDARTLVGCGHGHDRQTLRIVDPERRITLQEGEVGEVWVKGPHVSRGYFGFSDESFDAVVGGEGGFLRTGDLGFLRNGELFLTGRLKEQIILHGKNHFPHDLEATVAQALVKIPERRIAAVSNPVRASTLSIVIETNPDERPSDEELRAARRALFDVHGLSVDDVRVVPSGTIPRTSSGKKRRMQLGELLLEPAKESMHDALERR